MTLMVERVARAIHARWVATCFDADQRSWDELEDRHRKFGYGLARAAIEAMLEPTETMLKADVSLGGYGYNDECCTADPREVWESGRHKIPPYVMVLLKIIEANPKAVFQALGVKP